jgi:tetratricopeptide (TPR) repeat protein
MPRREDIEKFKQVLNSLGSEPAIRQSRSETIEDVAPPPEQEGGPAGSEETPRPARKAPAEKSATAVEEAEPGVDFDFTSLFGDESAAPGLVDLEAPSKKPKRAAKTEKKVEPPPKEAQAPEGEASAFPEPEPGGMLADLDQLEVLPEDLGGTIPSLAEEAQAETEAAGGPGEPSQAETFESFEDLGMFAPQAPEQAGAEPAVAEEVIAPAVEPSPPSTESIELPSLEDLSLDEIEEGPGPSAEPAAFAEPALSEEAFAFEAPAPTAEGEAPAEAAPSEEMGMPAEGVEFPSFGDEVTSAPPAPPTPEPAMETLGEEGLGDLELDQLGFAQAPFGAPKGQPKKGKPAKPRGEAPPKTQRRARREAPRPGEMPEAGVPGAEVEELAGAEEKVELSQEQFEALKNTLASLPRNLKIAVQDAIGEGKAAGRELSRLVALLVGGASAEEIAGLTGHITGKRIRVPAGYEKKTGAAFEAERMTFAYAFRENILPLLRIIAITAVAGGLLAFFGYRFIYRPLSANANYRRGYTHLMAERYSLANESFARATSAWRMKQWYYRYAEAFAGKRQYPLAEDKYEELLRYYPNDKKGTLDYARMETRLTDYKKADGLLQRLLGAKMYDYEALLASGDNNMEWAAIDGKAHERARIDYATLIEKYGARDELLFRMLRYFIRTDNAIEADRLRVYYAQRRSVKVDPEVYAEFGGYLIDSRRLDYAQDVLFRAIEAKPDVAEIHYNLARYYRIVMNPVDERKALDVTVRLLKPTDPLSRKRIGIEVDTHTRLGEYFYAQKEYLAAQRELQQAIALVETNQKRKLIGAENLFGRPYADLADLHYYIQGDLGLALSFYAKAIENLYASPEIEYKVGFIHYAAEDYKDALSRFMRAENSWTKLLGIDALEPSAGARAEAAAVEGAKQTGAKGTEAMPRAIPGNLLFAMGNSFYLRGDYFAAQGYYLRLLDRLLTKKEAIGNLLPQEQPEHRSLMENLAKVNNNLGVTLFRIGERMGDRKRRSEALVYLASAAEISDALARDPQVVRRTEAKSLPFLNTRGILYPVKGFELQLYRLLPKDFTTLFF